MANELVRFTMGSKADLGTKAKEAGQVLFVLNSDNKSGSIYLDKDSTNRIRMSYDLKDLNNSFSESAALVTTITGKVYPVALDADGYLAVSVPWTDTTYTAGAGLTLTGKQFKHTNSITAGTASGSATKTLTFGDTFTIPTITYDAQGHITNKGTTTMTMPALNVSNATAGTLSVSRGGTGSTTVNIYGVVYGNSAGNAYSSTQGASGSYLVGGGSSTAPSWHTPAQLRNAIGLGNTTGVLEIAYGGTGGNSFSSARTNLGINKIYSGTCSTDPGVAIKVVSCSNFVLEKGAVIFVTFDNTNTAAVADLKLNVNNTGEKPIKYLLTTNDPANLPAVGYIRANQTYMFQYDGTNWNISVEYNTNSTYSAMSVAEARTGTATSSRAIRADYLKTFLSTLGGTGLTFTHDATDGIVLNHSNSITAGTASGSANGTLSFGETITIPSITYDSEGHITSTSTTTVTLPSNPNVDNKVSQTNTTGDSDYRILFSGTADDTTRTEGARKNTSLKYNPSTTTLLVPKINTTGDISIVSIAETDKFLNFSYGAATSPGASWRIGHKGSGSGDGNYFVIQSGTSTTSATTWNNVLQLGMNTYDATFSGNVNPAVTDTKTLGTSSLKWANVYATTFTGDLAGNAATATNATNATNATSATNALAANKLNVSAQIGSETVPVYFSSNGIPVEANTYAGGTAVTLNGTSKAGSTASFYAPTTAGTSGYYLKSNGSGAPTWAAFPTSMTPTSHSHGNITNSGTMNPSQITIANNDFIVVGDYSDSTGKITKGPIFDGSTTTKALTPKGTWETFNNYSLPLATSSVRGGVKIGYTSSGQNYAVQLSNEQMYVNVPWVDTTYTGTAPIVVNATSHVISITDGTITNAKLQNSSMSIAGNSVSLGGSLAADTLRTSLGLSTAMHYRGKATVTISDGGTQDPTITGYDFTNDKMAGDVIIDKDGSMEYVWSGTAWERLGSETSFKTIQTAKSSPSANGTATSFIDTISQDSNGVITATKKNLPSSLAVDISGNAATATTLKTARTIAISGGATGTATSFDGSADITIPVTALDVSKANAGTLAIARGGTGMTAISAYEIIYGNSSSNGYSRLTPNTTTTKKFLRMTGTGSAGAAPAWDTVTKSDVGLGNVENTKLSTWTGNTSISSIGTLTVGSIPWSLLTGIPSSFKASSKK